MDVVLRTVLRHFAIDTTTAPDEKIHSRGVAYTPKAGGRVVMRGGPRRSAADTAAVLERCAAVPDYCEAVSRFGSFQPARGKWQVYPLGYFCR